jgi:serine/threonine protein phosphatase 1
MVSPPPPILFLADLHGNAALFDAAIAEARRRAGRDDLTVVASGDFCDNGPSTPQLIERCLEFSQRNPEAFRPILGNHDLACLLTLGLVPAAAGVPPEEAQRAWWNRWGGSYANSRSVWTPTQYGAKSQSEFEQLIPQSHRDFLANLPWYRRLGGYVFVHAGLKPAPVKTQLDALDQRSLHDLKLGFQPPQLRDKSLATVNHPDWGVVVVSGHTKLPGGQDFLASHRLTLHSAACRGQGLRAALLPPTAPKAGLQDSVIDRFQIDPL